MIRDLVRITLYAGLTTVKYIAQGVFKYKWHEWERTGKGIRTCSGCGQKIGLSATKLPVFPCDTEICRDVLHT